MKPAHLWTSRKLWMTLIAAGIIWCAYERSIKHLYAMTPEKVAALVALTQTALYAVAGIASAYVSVRGMVQMRQGVSSVVSEAVTETVNRASRPRDFEDESHD